jgi:F-type H+-transporting ATPase subunit delta
MANVARRYANALIKLNANDHAKAKSTLVSLKVLAELFDNEESKRVLQSPVMPIDLKKNLLNYGLQQGEASADLKALIDIIADAGRVKLIPKIVEEYQVFLDEMQGTVKAEVTTAVELNDSERQSVVDALSALIKKKVEIQVMIDPSILGGFVANIGNYRIDLSLKSKLEGISQNAVIDTLG